MNMSTLLMSFAGACERLYEKTSVINRWPISISWTLVLVAFASPSWAHHNTNHNGGPSGGDGGGDGGGGECAYPAFADKPSDKLRGNAADFDIKYGELVTSIKNGQSSVEQAPDFEETGAFDGGWFYETMEDEQHRVGNQGIAADGSAASGTPVGKRWSAWYDDTDLVTTFGGVLELGGKVVTDPDTVLDPTRPGTDWKESRLYTTWLSTFQRQVGVFGSAVPGSFSFKPPMYLETQVSFTQMQTPGFRVSMWMMPVETDTPADRSAVPSIAYDTDYKNGFEIDIFEYEPTSVTNNGTVCGNLIEFSWIRGFHSGKGKAPSGLDGKNHFEGPEEGYCSSQDCSLTHADPNGQQPDINVGSHTIGLLWTEELIAWSFNNELVLEITDYTMIPTRDHYLIVSREMTNGLSQGQFQMDSVTNAWEVFLPAEPGLYGWNGNSNVGAYLDNVATDKALIDYIKVWGEPVNY